MILVGVYISKSPPECALKILPICVFFVEFCTTIIKYFCCICKTQGRDSQSVYLVPPSYLRRTFNTQKILLDGRQTLGLTILEPMILRKGLCEPLAYQWTSIHVASVFRFLIPQVPLVILRPSSRKLFAC